VPDPPLGRFIPANWRVVQTQRIDLDGRAPEETVVTAVGTPNDIGVPRTLVVLAWDSAAQRWTTVFDAGKQPGIDDAHSLLEPRFAVSDVRVTPIKPTAGRRTDLLFSALETAGGHGWAVAGIIHYADQVATLELSINHDSGGTVHAVGVPGAQQVKAVLPWRTEVDGYEEPVRNYTVMYGLRDGTWRALHDDRPLLGVTCLAVEQDGNSATSVGAAAGLRVTAIAPGSAAAGRLAVGDSIVGVDGTQPRDSDGGLGPAVVDQIARAHSGDTIRVQVLRNGELRVVPLIAGSFPLSDEEDVPGTGTAPVPGFLGVATAAAASGAQVTEVFAASPAEQAGITDGDTITAVDGGAVHSGSDVAAAVVGHPPGATITLQFVGVDDIVRTTTATLTNYPQGMTPPTLIGI
jgi:membrane-associated protease RseP (regulator of RpoE activity)